MLVQLLMLLKHQVQITEKSLLVVASIFILNDSLGAHQVNVVSIKDIIKNAGLRGAKIVFPSSENIFDGRHFGYNEEDTPAPLTIYGKQKVAVEEFLKEKNVSSLLNLTLLGQSHIELPRRSMVKFIISLLLNSPVNPAIPVGV